MTGDSRNYRNGSDDLVLEAHAFGAGCALACPFLSSDEYEADLISSRRAAGVYGRSHARHALLTAAGIAAAVMVLILVTA